MTDTELLDWLIEQGAFAISPAHEWFVDGKQVESPMRSVPDWSTMKDAGRLVIRQVGFSVQTSLMIEASDDEWGSAATPRLAIERAIIEFRQREAEQAATPAGGKT